MFESRKEMYPAMLSLNRGLTDVHTEGPAFIIEWRPLCRP